MGNASAPSKSAAGAGKPAAPASKPKVPPEKSAVMTAKAQSRLIDNSDMGLVGVPFQFAVWLRKFKGSFPGNVLYRGFQGAIGAGLFLAWKTALDVPVNALSITFAALFFVGAILGGGLRFMLWSYVFLPLVGFIASLFIGQAFYSAGWWRNASKVWASGESIPWWWLGIGFAAAIFWIGIGRLACRGMGIGVFNLIKWFTLKRAQQGILERQALEATAFEESKVMPDEVRRVMARDASDRNRAVIFQGAPLVAASPTTPTAVAAATPGTDDDVTPEEQGAPPARIDLLKGLTPDLSDVDKALMSGMIPSDDDDSSDVDEELEASETPKAKDAPAIGALNSFVSGIRSEEDDAKAEQLENEFTGTNAQRQMYLDLHTLIMAFKLLQQFDRGPDLVKTYRTRLLKLTDEDYEIAAKMEYGDEIITLSRQVKAERDAQQRPVKVIDPEPVEDADSKDAKRRSLVETLGNALEQVRSTSSTKSAGSEPVERETEVDDVSYDDDDDIEGGESGAREQNVPNGDDVVKSGLSKIEIRHIRSVLVLDRPAEALLRDIAEIEGECGLKIQEILDSDDIKAACSTGDIAKMRYVVSKARVVEPVAESKDPNDPLSAFRTLHNRNVQIAQVEIPKPRNRHLIASLKREFDKNLDKMKTAQSSLTPALSHEAAVMMAQQKKLLTSVQTAWRVIVEKQSPESIEAAETETGFVEVTASVLAGIKTSREGLVQPSGNGSAALQIPPSPDAPTNAFPLKVLPPAVVANDAPVTPPAAVPEVTQVGPPPEVSPVNTEVQPQVFPENKFVYSGPRRFDHPELRPDLKAIANLRAAISSNSAEHSDAWIEFIQAFEEDHGGRKPTTTDMLALSGSRIHGELLVSIGLHAQAVSTTIAKMAGLPDTAASSDILDNLKDQEERDFFAVLQEMITEGASASAAIDEVERRRIQKDMTAAVMASAAMEEAHKAEMDNVKDELQAAQRRAVEAEEQAEALKQSLAVQDSPAPAETTSSAADVPAEKTTAATTSQEALLQRLTVPLLSPEGAAARLFKTDSDAIILVIVSPQSALSGMVSLSGQSIPIVAAIESVVVRQVEMLLADGPKLSRIVFVFEWMGFKRFQFDINALSVPAEAVDWKDLSSVLGVSE